MRIVQSLLALALCGVLVYYLATAYLVIAAIMLFVALATGVARHGWHRAEDLVASMILALVWPVLVLAFVTYLVSGREATELAVATSARSRSRARKSGVTGVEDLEQRERRDQR